MAKLDTYVNIQTRQRCIAKNIHEAAEKLKTEKANIIKLSNKIK